MEGEEVAEPLAFEELVAEYGEEVLEKLRRPTGYQSIKYTCLRCQTYKWGPGFAVLVQDTIDGICARCATQTELRLARKFPIPERRYPVKKEKNAGREFVQELMARPKHKRHGPTDQPIPQPSCDRCHLEAAGGRRPAIMDTTLNVCGKCYDQEVADLNATLGR